MTGARQVVETGQVEVPRPRRRNPLTRVTASHLLMALAAVLAFATNLMVLRNQEATRPVVVAGSRIEAGRPITATDLSLAEVDVDDQLYTTLIPGQQSSGLVGMVATRTISEGQLLSSVDVRSPSAPGQLRAMSVPIDIEHAVGGDLVAGDRVDLISVAETGASYILTNAEVLSVPSGERGSLTSITGFYLVLAVDESQALDLAYAIRQGHLEVVRSTGATQVQP